MQVNQRFKKYIYIKPIDSIFPCKVLEIQGFTSSCLIIIMTFVHQYSFFFPKKITICVNIWYICIYTIDLILFGNVDENLVVFDDFQIITFNAF